MPAPRLAPLEPPFPPGLGEELASMMPPGLPPLRLFRTLAHNPRVLTKIRLANLLDRGSIARREREIVILRTCARCGAEYEWGVHVAFFAGRVGLSPAQVEATRLGSADAPVWSPRERLLLRLVDELHEGAALGDPLWAELAREWSEEQLVELVVLTGFYHTISFVVNAFRVEAEDGAPGFPG
jgi:alkylhydroperoxidase family enzyme